MKFVRYLIDNKESYGILKKNKIHKVNGDPFTGYQITSKILDINEVINSMFTILIPDRIDNADIEKEIFDTRFKIIDKNK